MDETVPGSGHTQSRICPICDCEVVDHVDSWARDAQKRVVHLRCQFPQPMAKSARVIDEQQTECRSDENGTAALAQGQNEPAESERKPPIDGQNAPVDLPRIYRTEFKGRTATLALTALATSVMLAVTALFISLPSTAEVNVFVPARGTYSSSERAGFNELDDPHLQMALAIADDESYRPARYETRTAHANWAPVRFGTAMITVGLLILLWKQFAGRQQKCLEALRFATRGDSLLRFSIDSPGWLQRKFEIFGVVPATREPVVAQVYALTAHAACRVVRERGLIPQLVATKMTIAKAPGAQDVPMWTLIPVSAGILLASWLVFRIAFM